MIDADSLVAGAYPPLSDDEPLYRAVTDSRWFKNGVIRNRVFMLRPPNKDTGISPDKDGLSVGLRNNRDDETVCVAEAGQFDDCQHVCIVRAGAVRSLSLDAIQDEEGHANIVGLPEVPRSVQRPAIATPEGIEAREVAERMGDLLAKCVERVWSL